MKTVNLYAQTLHSIGMDKTTESITCMECLKISRCFRQLLPTELDFINHYKVQIHYSMGEDVCKQGAFASSIIYVLDGLIKLSIEGPNNKSFILRIVNPAEFIGLSSLYGENTYHYSARTLMDTTICMIEKESIKKLIRENGVFATEIIKWHCHMETHHYKKIQSLTYKQLHGRLADTLIYLCRENFGISNVFKYLTRKDLAELSAMSTEGAVRILSEFDKDGIIKLKGKDIKILDLEKLVKISKAG
jgi:CRP-like cAMP-binding protein